MFKSETMYLELKMYIIYNVQISDWPPEIYN